MDRDAEIIAMDAIERALRPLDLDARRRVVEWARDRWAVEVVVESAADMHPTDPRRVTIVPLGPVPLAGPGVDARRAKRENG